MPAARLMSVDEWKSNTSLTFRMRGPRLRAVDTALAEFHKDQSSSNLLILLNAVELYRTTREGGWENYRRNKGHIFEVLMSQLFNLASNDDVVQAMAALPFFGIESWAVEGVGGANELADAIRAERQNRLTQLLTGRSLRFKLGSVAWQQGKILLPAAAQVGHGLHQAASVGGAACGNSVVDAMSNQASAIGSEFMSIIPIPKAELVGMVPVFGLIFDGLKTAWEWKVYAGLVNDKGQFPGFLAGCSGDAGDIRAAISAVQAYLEKRIASQLALAGIQSAGFVAKLGTFFADGGTASNAAITGVKAALNMLVKLQFAYDEYREMKAAQLLLNTPDARIFSACPLLGCYMVTACDHSDLLNMFDGRRELSKYWQFEAMYYVAEINKLRDMARSYISNSYVELIGPESAHNTTANKLRWMGQKAAVALRMVDHQKALKAGTAISSDAA
ncbi:MAG: hypothetical protein KF861_09130 [Planctomycetaceae bacterium]|nr:hypothetical protein [Planctomycetaceae bacterium]